MKQDEDELRKQFNAENVDFNESGVRIVPNSWPSGVIFCPVCKDEILLQHNKIKSCWDCRVKFKILGSIAFYGSFNTTIDDFRNASKKWFEQAPYHRGVS